MQGNDLELYGAGDQRTSRPYILDGGNFNKVPITKVIQFLRTSSSSMVAERFGRTRFARDQVRVVVENEWGGGR